MGLALPHGWRRWLIAAALLLAGTVVLVAVDPSGALLSRVVGVAAMTLFVVSVIVMLLTFRKARLLSSWMLVMSATISIVCTGVFFALTGAPASAPVIVAAIIAGLLVGIGWSLTNLLFVDGSDVRARGNLWFLAVWGISLALPQVAALFGGRTPYAVAVISFVGMGLAVGNSLGLVARGRAARRQNGVRAGAPT
jgi:hypothetical protein